eukprot:gene8326-biopygen15157
MLSKGGVASSVWRKRRNLKDLQKHIAPRITFGSRFRVKLQNFGGVGKIGMRSFQSRLVAFSIVCVRRCDFWQGQLGRPSHRLRAPWPRGDPQGSCPRGGGSAPHGGNEVPILKELQMNMLQGETLLEADSEPNWKILAALQRSDCDPAKYDLSLFLRFLCPVLAVQCPRPRIPGGQGLVQRGAPGVLSKGGV